MNRRSFFKTITGYAAGVVAAFVPGKSNATMYISPDKKSTESLSEKFVPDWNKLGCKDCFRGCGQWDDCRAAPRRLLATIYGDCNFYKRLGIPFTEHERALTRHSPTPIPVMEDFFDET